MEIRQLKSVVTVADCRCFGKAATLLAISQPALSISVKNLEKEVGAEIFVRARNDVVPTEFGTEFLIRARSVLREVEKTRDLVRSSSADRTRLVCMGIDGLLSGPLIHRVAPLFSDAFGNVELQADVATVTVQEAMIRISSGQWDFGIVLAHEGISIPKGLVATVLSRVTTVPHGRKDHPLASRRQVSPEELAARRWVLSTRISGNPQVATFTKALLRRPTIAARTNSFDSTKILIESTDWLTLLPAEIVARFYRRSFARLSTEVLRFNSNVLLLQSRDTAPQVAARALIDWVTAAVGA